MQDATPCLLSRTLAMLVELSRGWASAHEGSRLCGASSMMRWPLHMLATSGKPAEAISRMTPDES